MIKINLRNVYGFEDAVHGMRNSHGSWNKSDSVWQSYGGKSGFCLGEQDLSLMRRLSTFGDDHAKFERFIHVVADINAPLYWWKEFDTYRAGVEKLSCSTMHSIHTKPFVADDFSHDALDEGMDAVFSMVLLALNALRERYITARNNAPWRQLIQLLPESYNQQRTVQVSYQALKNIYFARANHRLEEWHEFCEWALTLPYFNEICVGKPAASEGHE